MIDTLKPEMKDITFIDYLDIIPGSNPKPYGKFIRDLVKEIQNRDIEIFCCESPYNKYQPQPPEGYTAFRSHKRRLFVKDGYKRDFSNNIKEEIKSGLIIQLPLCKAYDEI